MSSPFFEGLEELTVGLGTCLILATGAVLFQTAFRGWKGIRHFCTLLSAGVVVSILAHWGCQHYGITGTLNAVVIGVSALFSYMIMDVLFSPQLKEALLQRLEAEIRNRGRKEQDRGEAE